MNNEIFKLNDRQYSLDYEPAKLSFNEYPKLKAQVDSLRDEFSNWQVTPENIKSSKEVRAKLRKFSKTVNSKKIKIVKVIDEPVTNFKKQIKDLCKEVDVTAETIDQQVKQFEATAKHNKHEHNIKLINQIAAEKGADSKQVIDFAINSYNSSWDNQSYTYKQFKTDVEQLINEAVKLQQVKDEAHQVIVKETDALGLMASHYIQAYDNGKALTDVLSDMADERKYLDDLGKKQAETKKQEQASLKQHGDVAFDPTTGEVKEKVYTRLIEIKATKYQLKQLVEFLKQCGISAKRVK